MDGVSDGPSWRYDDLALPGHRAIAAIASVAVVAYVIANVAHEGAHGVACVALGGKPIALSAIYFDCDKTEMGVGVKWAAAAGTLANFALAGVALVALRLVERRASTRRYFWWLFFTVNALQGAGYWLFSGVANIGDWAVVIRGLGPHWLWRAGLALAGAVAYLGVIRRSLQELGAFLGDGDERFRRARRLTLVPYLTGGVVYVAAGLLNPISLHLVLISAVAASFGGTSAMAWMFNLVQASWWSPPEGGQPFAPTLARGWTVAGVVTAVLFIGLLGPSVRF